MGDYYWMYVGQVIVCQVRFQFGQVFFGYVEGIKVVGIVYQCVQCQGFVIGIGIEIDYYFVVFGIDDLGQQLVVFILYFDGIVFEQWQVLQGWFFEYVQVQWRIWGWFVSYWGFGQFGDDGIVVGFEGIDVQVQWSWMVYGISQLQGGFFVYVGDQFFLQLGWQIVVYLGGQLGVVDLGYMFQLFGFVFLQVGDGFGIDCIGQVQQGQVVYYWVIVGFSEVGQDCFVVQQFVNCFSDYVVFMVVQVWIVVEVV